MIFDQKTTDNLEKYQEILLKTNQQFNLISKNTEKDIFLRHIEDSYQLLPLIKKEQKILDFGTGAGLPGLVLNICGINDVTLVESTTKKCLFLEKIKKELNLNCKIINDRVENVFFEKYDVITARAVASLDKLFNLIKHLLHSNLQVIFLKGKNYQKEVEIAEKIWQFSLKTVRSKTSDESVILIITNLKKKNGDNFNS